VWHQPWVDCIKLRSWEMLAGWNNSNMFALFFPPRC